MSQPPPPFLTVAQVAARLNCSKKFVYSLLRSCRLKHYTLGKRQGAKRISEEQLAAYLATSEHGGEPAAPAPPSPRPRRQPFKLKHL